MMDTDQGGVERDFIKVYCGPTIGWVRISMFNGVEYGQQEYDLLLNDGISLLILQGGGYLVLQWYMLPLAVPAWTNFVEVNTPNIVPPAIQLPTAIAPTIEPITYVPSAMVIADSGGFAATNNITVVPFGTEKIDGASSVQITTAHGSVRLFPDTINGGWTLV
jgi:hypothetical protein